VLKKFKKVVRSNGPLQALRCIKVHGEWIDSSFMSSSHNSKKFTPPSQEAQENSPSSFVL
jgi:hypothetical protein